MLRLILTLVLMVVSGPVAFGQWTFTSPPPCGCGCMETGQCTCKNCCDRTGDPKWRAGNVQKTKAWMAVGPVQVGDSSNPYEIDEKTFARELKAYGVMGLVVGSVKNPFFQTYYSHYLSPSGFRGLQDGTYLVHQNKDGSISYTVYTARTTIQSIPIADQTPVIQSFNPYNYDSIQGFGYSVGNGGTMQGGTCTGPNCGAQSSGSVGFWYPGKNFRRR